MNPHHNEIVGFCRDILKGNYDAAGVLADFLEEHGTPEEQKKGVLLRRRWRMWQKKMKILTGSGSFFERRRKGHTDLFHLYLRGKFSQEMYEASDPQKSEAWVSG